MENRKLDDALSVLIDLIIEEEWGENASREVKRNLSDKQLQEIRDSLLTSTSAQIFRILPSGISGNSKDVICKMPNNNEVVSRSAAVQCRNDRCAEFFCKSHKISQCPLCGGSVA